MESTPCADPMPLSYPLGFDHGSQIVDRGSRLTPSRGQRFDLDAMRPQPRVGFEPEHVRERKIESGGSVFTARLRHHQILKLEIGRLDLIERDEDSRA